MTKNEIPGGSRSCKIGECAAIVCATEDNGSFVAGLLARAIATHERGLPGRCS